MIKTLLPRRPTPDARRPTPYFLDRHHELLSHNEGMKISSLLPTPYFQDSHPRAIAHNEEMKIPVPRRPTPDARRPDALFSS